MAEAEKRCPTCGMPIPEGFSQCPACKDMLREDMTPRRAPVRPGARMLRRGVLVAAAILALAALIVFLPREDDTPSGIFIETAEGIAAPGGEERPAAPDAGEEKQTEADPAREKLAAAEAIVREYGYSLDSLKPSSAYAQDINAYRAAVAEANAALTKAQNDGDDEGQREWQKKIADGEANLEEAEALYEAAVLKEEAQADSQAQTPANTQAQTPVNTQAQTPVNTQAQTPAN